MSVRSWILPAALLAACGGNVVVDPGGSSAPPTSTRHPGSVGTGIGAGGSVGTGIGVGGSIGSGMGNGGGTIVGVGGGISSGCATMGCTMFCAGALANGGMPCSTNSSATSAYANITSCVQQQCATECPSFLQGCPLDTDVGCSACALMRCNMSDIFCLMN
jgi:hypothetical protein